MDSRELKFNLSSSRLSSPSLYSTDLESLSRKVSLPVSSEYVQPSVFSVCGCGSWESYPCLLQGDVSCHGQELRRMSSWSTQAAITKYHRLGMAEAMQVYFSWFWGLEVLEQSAGWFGSLLEQSPGALCVLTWWRASISLVSLLRRELIRLLGPHPHDLI